MVATALCYTYETTVYWLLSIVTKNTEIILTFHYLQKLSISTAFNLEINLTLT